MGIATDDIAAAVAAVKAATTKAEAARRLGIHRATLNRRLAAAQDDHQPTPATETDAPWHERHERDYVVVIAKAGGESRIRTADDAIRKAALDPAVWEVQSVEVTAWDVTMKLRKAGADTPFRGQNQRIRIVFRRRVPKPIEDAAAMLARRLARHAPRYPKLRRGRRGSDPHLAVMSLFDAHLGKLAWAGETGENYDLRGAERVFADSVSSLLGKLQAIDVERILFPVGNDFLHVDYADNTTTAGTVQDVDGRYAKVFEVGFMALLRAIDAMAAVAPVDVVWVPGNHDRTTSWHLVHSLRQAHRRHERVSYDLDSGLLRKYVTYGATLIGLTHGCDERHADLPTIMATEAPQAWAATQYREWLIGHLHRRREMRFLPTSTHGGVSVHTLPSLSGTDHWHYRKGFVGASRTADVRLYSRGHGPAGYLPTHAQSRRS